MSKYKILVNEEFENWFSSLMAALNTKDQSVVVNSALSLFSCAVEAAKEGKEICIFDERTRSLQTVDLACLTEIREAARKKGAEGSISLQE